MIKRYLINVSLFDGAAMHLHEKGDWINHKDYEYLESRHRALVEAGREAILQIEYLHGRFGDTGSGEQCLAKLRQALQEDNK